MAYNVVTIHYHSASNNHNYEQTLWFATSRTRDYCHERKRCNKKWESCIIHSMESWEVKKKIERFLINLLTRLIDVFYLFCQFQRPSNFLKRKNISLADKIFRITITVKTWNFLQTVQIVHLIDCVLYSFGLWDTFFRISIYGAYLFGPLRKN